MTPKSEWTIQDIFPRLEKFKSFISERGAQILDVTNNEWEVLRFKTDKGTSVIYKNKKGEISFFQEAEEAWLAYKSGGQWRANHPPKRKPAFQNMPALAKRDGTLCFFCQKPLNMIDDTSVEHLVARTHGGPNHMSNFYLAHKTCNNEVGFLSAPEKIKIHTEAVVKRILEELMIKVGYANVL